MPLNSLLKLIDRYIRQVPIKGGHCWWTPDIIIMTANKGPMKWYKFEPTEQYPDGRKDKEVALRRRFDIIYAWNGKLKQFDLYEGPEAIARYWPITINEKSSPFIPYHCTGMEISMDNPNRPIDAEVVDIPTTNDEFILI